MKKRNLIMLITLMMMLVLVPLSAAAATHPEDDHAVTVKTMDDNETVPVTIEFGAGHKNFAEKFINIQSGATVIGTKLTFNVAPESTYGDVREIFIDKIIRMVDRVDNDEYLMQDGIALHDVSAYSSQEEMRQEQTTYDSQSIPDQGVTFHALWAKPVGPVSVAITPPAIGTNITVVGHTGDAHQRSNPEVEATVIGYATLDTDSGRSWMNSNYKNFFTGTVQPGQNCYASIYLDAKYGYYFSGDDSTWARGTSVIVTGASGVITKPSNNIGAQVCAMVWPGPDPEPPVYNVNVDSGITGGTVAVHPITAHQGNTVKVDATPTEGYVLKSLTYTPAGGSPVTINTSSDGGTYSVDMPGADVTLSAVFDKENMVYVDFGKGHEEFVQKYFGGKENFEVNGAVVSFQYDEVEVTKNAGNARAFFVERYSSYIDNSLDGSVRYMYDIALHPRDHYSNQSERDTEKQGYTKPIRDGITFYALWAKPLTDVVMTVTPPACGTEVKMKYKTGSYVWAQPSPQRSVEGNCHFENYNLFYNDWDLSEYNVKSVGQSLTMTGGHSYTATGYLSADWGYFLPENPANAVTVHGGTLIDFGNNNLDNYFRISVPVTHTPGADGKCLGCGEEVHTVTYKVVHGTWADGTTADKQEGVKSGEKPVHVPTSMKADSGYTGGAWDTNPATATINSNKTFTYSFRQKQSATYTVTFNVGDHGTAPAAQTVTEGGRVRKPDDLIASGFTFGGWFRDAACTQAYDFASPVTRNITLYAKWTEGDPDTHTVSFDAGNHGTAPEAQKVKDGEKALKPDDPTESGFTFDGWYVDAACKSAYDFDTPVTEDITLYAKWTSGNIPDIYFAAHVQNKGWDKIPTHLKAGQSVDVGTTGQGLRIEAIVIMVPENYTIDGFAHVQNRGDMAVNKIETAADYAIPEGYAAYQFGTTGKAQRLEAICIGIRDANGEYIKGFQYAPHLQNYGWQGYVQNNSFAGARGMALRLEALRFSSTEPNAVNPGEPTNSK